MLIFNFEGDEFKCPTTPDEMSLAQFDEIIAISNDETLGSISRCFKMLEFFGVPEKVLDNLSQKEFVEAYKALVDYEIPIDIEKSIEVNGRTYEAYNGEEFEFNARTIELIEIAQMKNDSRFASWVMAVVYKDVDLSWTEHKDWNHIKHKANLFRKELTGAHVIPLLPRLARRQMTQLEDAIQKD